MKKHFSIKILSVVALVGILGFAGYAVADGGWGNGNQRGYMAMNAPDDCPRWGGGQGKGPGGGKQAGLSQEDAKAFEAQREAFFNATKTLRGDLYQKQLELRSEMAKAEPDAKAAGDLQTEISKLRGDFDQKRLAHRLEMRKMFPDAGRGIGSGRGYRNGHGRGFGGCRQ